LILDLNTLSDLISAEVTALPRTS